MRSLPRVAADGGLPGPSASWSPGLVILGRWRSGSSSSCGPRRSRSLTALLPIVLAASLWPPAVAWARRLAETLGALIVSKAVIVLVLSLALDAVANAGSGASTALTGGALLLLAAFMPYVVLKLVPAVELAAVSHLESVRRRGTATSGRAAGRAVSMAVAAMPAPKPTIDTVGSNPVGMLQGIDDDIFAGTALDPTVSRPKGRPPILSVPASAGTHVWERDRYGPRLVWRPPGYVPDD